MDTKDRLLLLIEKEVSLMREILANLYLQECCKKRGINLDALLQSHSYLNEELEKLQAHKNNLPAYLEESCEISLLFNQLAALKEKIAEQNLYNQHLVAIEMPFAYPSKGKKTIAVI